MVLGALFVLMVLRYGRIEYEHPRYARWDLHLYRAIAHAAPRLDPEVWAGFNARLLGPYVVGLLPVPDPVGFRVYSVVAALALVVSFYLFLCHVGVRPAVALFTTFLFMCNRYMFGLLVWDIFRVNDLLSLFFLVVLFWAMLRGRWALFGLVMLAGNVTRETTILMVPVAAVCVWEQGRLGKEWKPLLAVSVLAVGSFLAIKAVVPGRMGFTMAEAFVHYAKKKLPHPYSWFQTVINPYIPFTLVPFVFWSTTRRFFRQRKHMLLFVLLVLVSTLFGRDYERLMAPTFIVFFWLIGTLAEEHLRSERRMLALLAAWALVASLSYRVGHFTLPNRAIMEASSVAALTAVTIGCYLFKRRRGPQLAAAECGG